MITYVSVKTTAGHADYPLAPISVPLAGSWTIIVVDLPRAQGVAITGGRISLADVTGATHTAECDKIGNTLRATFDAADFPGDTGEVLGTGIVIDATGTIDGAEASWEIGHGTMRYVARDGDGGDRGDVRMMHLLDGVPELPAKGDCCYFQSDLTFKVYDGVAWRPLGQAVLAGRTFPLETIDDLYAATAAIIQALGGTVA